MGNEQFQQEYDLSALTCIQPRGQEFSMYVTPRYHHHYVSQEYERYTTRFISRVLSRCSLFVDVGANYGFYTLLAGTQHPDLEIIALEPVPQTFEALRRSAEAAGLQKLTLEQAAATERDGTALFYISLAADNCGFSPHPAAPPLRQVDVRTCRLDTLLKQRRVVPTLIKIDVEGHELSVLQGMEETLARFSDLTLLLEFNPKMFLAAGRTVDEAISELERLGFALFLLDDELCRPYRLRPGTNWRPWLARLGYANVYCVRKEAALSLCFFSHSVHCAGAEQSLAELVGELVSDYGAVCSVVMPGYGPLVGVMEKAGAACLAGKYEWWAAKPPGVIGAERVEDLQPQLAALIQELLPALNEVDPDVIWTQTLVIPWGAAAAALLGKPHVWSVCEYGGQDYGLPFLVPFDEVVEDILGCSAFVYTCGQKLGETLFPGAGMDLWRALPRNVQVSEGKKGENPTGYFKHEGAIRLGLFATLDDNKGQADAVRAVAQVFKDGESVELLLAGYVHPEYATRLEALVAQQGLEGRVRVPGFVTNRFAAMRQCDIVLVCSRVEAFGRVGVEGMLLGKAVVYAAAGGALEYMQDGRTGLAYPAGDSAALAERIRRLIHDPALRARLGAEGQAFARGRFTRDRYGGEVYRTLRGIARKPGRSARMPRLLEPMAGQVLVELVRQRQQLQAVSLDRASRVEQLGAALHQQQQQGEGSRLELASLLEENKRLLAVAKFLGKQRRSVQKRRSETVELAQRAAERLGWSAKRMRTPQPMDASQPGAGAASSAMPLPGSQPGPGGGGARAAGDHAEGNSPSP
jgi:FkbM family methyltransferase